MNRELQRIIHDSDSRYLTSEEKEAFNAYFERFSTHVKHAEAIEEAEEAAVRFCIENTRKRYPNFDKYHDKAWAKAFRDVQLTLRYNVQAMLLDDRQGLEDKLLYWLRTILAGFNFTPEFNRDTYTYLFEGIKKNVPPATADAISPFLERTIEIMSDFPEPAVAAV
jgi:hypothetical protein